MDEKIVTFNPWAKGRPEPKRCTVTLPESGLTLELIALNTIRGAAAADETEELVACHITGEDGFEPQPIEISTPEGPEEVEVNPGVIRDICCLRQMQPQGGRCNFIWWLGIATCYESDYQFLLGKVRELNAGSLLGNSRRTVPEAATSESSSS